VTLPTKQNKSYNSMDNIGNALPSNNLGQEEAQNDEGNVSIDQV
jgi:hypothetical protein